MTFEVSNIVDRKFEQELFAGMLEFSDDARLLTISDGGGYGKSTLLRRLQYNCDWRGPGSRIASSLVLLQELNEPDFFKVISQIRKDLTGKGIRFPECDDFFRAEVSKDFAPFLGGRTVGTVDATGAEIRGGVQAGIASVANIGRAEHVIMSAPTVDWSSGVKEMARDKCIEVFLAELRRVSAQTPVVLLFDTWERCQRQIQEQITDRLIRELCFENRTKLVIVLAGRDQFRFKDMLGEKPFGQLVRSIESFSDWEIGHVKDFFRVHNIKDIDDDEIELLQKLINRGKTSLQSALTALGDTNRIRC